MRSSVAPSQSVHDAQIDRTLEIWQPRARRDLSRDEARQIHESVVGFFNILAEWSQRETVGQATPSVIGSSETAERRPIPPTTAKISGRKASAKAAGRQPSRP